METGLILEVVDVDEDYLGVSLVASNGRFCGSIRKIYAEFGELARLATDLSGFPASSTDERTFELGGKDISGVTGSARLEFRAADLLGHAVLMVHIETAGWTGVTPGPLPENVAFSVAVDPASVDRFVQELRALESTHSGVARLESPS
ncbi:MAG TPA: hypothetical protein VIL17_03045 [Coriobacteriia bacterium]